MMPSFSETKSSDTGFILVAFLRALPQPLALRAPTSGCGSRLDAVPSLGNDWRSMVSSKKAAAGERGKNPQILFDERSTLKLKVVVTIKVILIEIFLIRSVVVTTYGFRNLYPDILTRIHVIEFETILPSPS